MTQATLTSFSPEAPRQSFGCGTCISNLGVVIVSGVEKVRCKGRGVRDPRWNGCSSWSDGSDRADYWPPLPENYVPPKEHRVQDGVA